MRSKSASVSSYAQCSRVCRTTGETEASFQCLLALTTLFTSDFFHLHDASSVWDGAHSVAGTTHASMLPAKFESAASGRCVLQCSLFFIRGHRHFRAAWATPCQSAEPPGGCRGSCLRKALPQGPTAVYHWVIKEPQSLLCAPQDLFLVPKEPLYFCGCLEGLSADAEPHSSPALLAGHAPPPPNLPLIICCAPSLQEHSLGQESKHKSNM